MPTKRYLNTVLCTGHCGYCLPSPQTELPAHKIEILYKDLKIHTAQRVPTLYNKSNTFNKTQVTNKTHIIIMIMIILMLMLMLMLMITVTIRGSDWRGSACRLSVKFSLLCRLSIKIFYLCRLSVNPM